MRSPAGVQQQLRQYDHSTISPPPPGQGGRKCREQEWPGNGRRLYGAGGGLGQSIGSGPLRARGEDAVRTSVMRERRGAGDAS